MADKNNSIKLTRTEYLAKWRKENPDYFKTYYLKHKNQINESVTRYRKTTKGKATIKAYEQSRDRKAGKKAYQQSLIKARDELLTLKEKGKV